MKQLKCNNCGASIDPSNNICEYCGASVIIESKNSKQKVNMTDEMLNSMLKITPSSNGIAPLIMFMVLWCGVAFFMGAAAIGMGAGLFAIVPFGMAAFGLVSMGKQVKILQNANFDELYRLYDNKEYKKAYGVLQEKLNNAENVAIKQTLLSQLVLISYYKLNYTEKAKEYLFILQNLNLPLNPSIKRVAEELNII